MNFKKVKSRCIAINWVVGCLIPLSFGIYAYTPEYEWIKKYINKKFEISIILAFLIFIIIVLIGTTIIIKILENAIKLECDKNDLKQELFQLKNSIDKNINISDAMNVNEALKGFVSNTEHVIAAQIYKCDEKISGKTIIYTIDGVDYKYVRFGEAVNDIRETYKVNKKYLDEYRELKKSYMDNPTNEMKNKWVKYSSKLTKEINEYSGKKITDNMISKYCYLVLSIQNIIGSEPVVIENIDQELQEKIAKAKRSGFLRGIIEQDLYKFKNNRNGKKNRIYITKYLYIENYPHIFVITLDETVNNRKDFSKYLDKVGEKFYDILTNELNIVYNKYKIN